MDVKINENIVSILTNFASHCKKAYNPPVQNSDITEEVLTTLRRIIRGVDLHSKKLVQKYGVTGPQLLILKEIERRQSIAISALANNVSLSTATVTSVLDRLEKRGYISRYKDTHDRRKVIVTATEQARHLIQQAPSLLQEDFIDSFMQLKQWEQTQILATLQRVAEMMNVKSLEASPWLVSSEIEK